MKITLGAILALAGATIGASALAQPFVVNISGATLQQNFFTAPASTNDFLDVDNDGFFRDQLAPFDVTIPFLANQYWQVQYRAVGSTNGLIELDTWSTVFAVNSTDIVAANADNAWNNRTSYIAAGVLQTPPGNAANPGGAPVRSLTNGTYTATTSSGPGTGIQVDINPLDVPVLWATTNGIVGDINPFRAPGSSGYGLNPRKATDAQGNELTQGNLLATLQVLNTNLATPDAFTVYDTPVAYTPVAPITNYGVGITQVTLTDLQHMFTTGRRINGENLMIVTRDSGSGTRNAFNNGIVIDPSWGIGDNIGPRSTSSQGAQVGPFFQPSNKGGQGRMEETVFNHRLAVGYSGPERGVNSGWLGIRADFLAVLDDVRGGTVYVRPTVDNILDNNPATGFNINGPAVFATVGDPRAEPVSLGGDNNGNPRMRNPAAAIYMNNVTRSIEQFKDVPGGDQTIFTPAEFLALNFLLPTAIDFVPLLSDPAVVVPNPLLNQALQDFTRANSVLTGPAYENFNTAAVGRVPTRTQLTGGQSYSDGVLNGTNFRDQAGNNVPYGGVLNARNKISGDFNNDGARTLADVPDMVGAWRDRNGGPAWQPGTPACIEILGDFDGDGSFTAEDLRYYADGLALVGGSATGEGNLNRFLGFQAIDNAFGGNFFGTTLATGVAYTSGASAGDVSGPSAQFTRGYRPIGHDGAVDAYDIDFVFANFGSWLDLEQAVNIDLSADMNGDLVVDIEDVRVIVENFLGTQIGDVNLDGVVDQNDLSIASGNLGMQGGWAMGDMNGDGVVTQADLDIIIAAIGGIPCPGDTNGDGIINFSDLNTVLSQFGQSGMGLAGDVNSDNIVNFSDLNLVLSNFGVNCN